MIHSKHPNLIGDFKSLKTDSKEQIFQNHQLAFSTAEKLGVTALLDAEDMLLCAPEPKSTQLYVFYSFIHFLFFYYFLFFY